MPVCAIVYELPDVRFQNGSKELSEFVLETGSCDMCFLSQVVS